MPSPLTPADLEADPLAAARSCPLPGGAVAVFRPLLPTDGPLLGAYFDTLSAETRSRFGPHPLDRATALRLCGSIDYRDALRLVAVAPGASGEEILAYFILLLHVPARERERYRALGAPLDPEADCTLAPSVADAWQGTGLGSLLLPHLIDLARRLGRRRMVLLGGTQATNSRAVRFYGKHGFRTVGTFEHPPGRWNHDMMLDLGG